MIDKDYFKRQATTLRKMIGIARDKSVAARLTFLADDFEAKAHEEASQPDDAGRPPGHGETGGSGRG